MKKIIYIVCAATSLFIVSCKDNIDFEYKSINPQYVIEGYVSNNGAEICVKTTQDMADTSEQSNIENANVIISGDDGSMQTLYHSGNGIYRSNNIFTGKTGITYTLNVTANGKNFKSTSQMQDKATIEKLFFDWQKILNEEVLCLNVKFNDIPKIQNYYWMRIYRNNKIYKWNVMKDLGYENSVIEKSITCISKTKLEEDNPDDHEKMLYEGDTIRFELCSIDKRTYDYLYSLRLSSSNRTNPNRNFTGDCLGFFAAYNISSKDIIFSRNNIN